MDGQVTWSDLGISFGRTLSEHSAATEEKTSTPCWKKLRVSQNQDFLYLDCRKSGNGQKQEPLTVMGGLSLGELTTLRTGEKPSETAVQEMLSVWGRHSVAEESVVADFGGESAAQIQFDRESVSGHPAESGAAGEGSAGAAESGASYAVRIRGGL